MRKLFLSLMVMLGCITISSAQFIPQKFGNGLQILGQDSTFYLRLGFRFQNLYTGEWTLADDDLGSMEDYRTSFLVRRSRLKFDGFAYSPKLKYKLEIALSNRDISGGSGPEFRNTSNVILDASVTWNFYKNFSIQFGQGKLPGNRERVISSGNLQLVDRSLLNSRYTSDRDVGLQFKHHFKIGKNFIVKEVIALTQGEGRNVTAGNFDGHNYTYRVEFLPFGKFQSKGDYIGSAIKRESTPKLAVGITYETNKNAVRERGQLGDFIKDANDNYYGKNLNTFFADLMFKYKGFSLMGEYAHKETSDGISDVFDVNDEVVGTFFTGSGFNLQAGYMFENNWEVAGRYTTISPNAGVSNDENQYTFGISKFVVGHKLKIQTDFTYRKIDQKDDGLLWRTQVDIHF